MPETFYVTTAIDYPNGKPHIGHVYEKIVTDTYARWYRTLGQDVYFLTGTDENGQKLVKSAEEAGATDTKSFIDRNVETFRKLCKDLELTNQDFIRTTEERHSDVAQSMWKQLEAKGDIYFDRYSGWYCLSCEAFYLESQVEDMTCPNHGTKLEYQEEDGYFFKLSNYRDWIIEHIKTNESFIFPKASRKEILSRLEGDELRDLSVSRPNAGWGIPTPSREDHVMYTWFDALINYYAAVDTDELKRYWPAAMHVIGKDITWFHSVIWPCMLRACDIPLPSQIHVHGMILAEDGRKMSKSLNNVIDPYDVLGKYSNDLLRYYMIRAVPSGGDGRFSIADMIDRHNNELANDFGNLASRVVKLAIKRIGNEVDPTDVTQDIDTKAVFEDMKGLMDAREHHRALDRLWECINATNSYLNENEPWRIKDDPKKFKQYIYNSLHAIHGATTLMQAFLPETAKKTFGMLGTGPDSGFGFGELTYKLEAGESLFPKIAGGS